MNLEEIKKRALEARSWFSSANQDRKNITWAADTILQLVAEVELWKKEVARVEQFSREEGARLFDATNEVNKLTAANKILRDGLEHYASNFVEGKFANNKLEEAEEILK